MTDISRPDRPVTDHGTGTGHHPENGRHADHAGHGAHAGHDHGDHAAVFRDKFWLSLILSVPVVAFSEGFGDMLGYSLSFPGSFLIAPVLGTVLFVYGGSPFLTGAVDEVGERRPGMMLLISMAITVAYAASLVTALGGFDVEVWWELALLIDVMLLGHWLEMRAVGQASGALEALAELLPDGAELVTDDGVVAVGIDQLEVGSVVLVRAGGRVPADGTVTEGSADVDESMLTGESRPRPRQVGDRVVAGTIATDSSLRIRIDAIGDDTTLAGIERLVTEAQESGSRAQALADRAAALLFYVALGAAIVTVVVWMALGQPDRAVTQAVTVLIIACPHALGLAIPLVTAIATSLAARHGILVRDRIALEHMRRVDTVMFDKTGTLTLGEHRVVGVAAVDGDNDGRFRHAGAVESDSEHPLARAITAAARQTGELPAATGFTSMTGRGVEATVNGTSVAVGGPALVGERDLEVPDALRGDIDQWRAHGASVLHVVRDRAVIGAIGLADAVRPESRAAIDALHAAGVQVGMLTGDAVQVAESVAAELGIDEVFAEVLPDDKDTAITDLQDRGRSVAMVGDGVNDAPALARADVGIAIGAGTDVAVESAGIVLASSDPNGVVAIRRLSAATYTKMLQNLWWAGGYNIIALPLAAGALAWAGFVMPMALGAVLMSLSTIVVALNAQLLRRVDLGAT